MPTINLVKGQKIDLTKTNPGLTEVGVALGWDIHPSAGVPNFDLDVYGLAVDVNKTLVDLCYFNQLTCLDGALTHSGDNRDGAGDGDDETITVNLSKVPANVDKVVVSANIFDALSTQNFGQVRNAFLRVYNKTTGEELCRYDLSEDYSVFQGVNFGELYRNGGEWKFAATTLGYNGTINEAIALL